MHGVTRNIHRRRWVRSGAFLVWHSCTYCWKLRAVKRLPSRSTISDRGPQSGILNLGSTVYYSQTVIRNPCSDTQLEFNFWLRFISFLKKDSNLEFSMMSCLRKKKGDFSGAFAYALKKRLLPSSCPHVHRYQRASHWTDFREICGHWWKSVPKTPNFAKIWQKYLTLYTKTHVLFIVAGDINSRWKHFNVTLSIFTLSMTRSLKIHADYIVAFPRQQWLRKCARVLRYTYIVLFVFYTRLNGWVLQLKRCVFTARYELNL
jgi:hypothetical protein